MFTFDFDTVNTNPDQFLVTENNRILDLGDYSLKLPLGYYRIPFTPRLGADEYVTGSVGGNVSSAYYFRRLDLQNTDIEKKYRQKILRVFDKEKKVGEGSFQFSTGTVDFIKAEKLFEGHKQTRYQSMFYPDASDWQKCSLYSEHLVIWQDGAKVIISEQEGVSTALLEILGTLHRQVPYFEK